MLLIFDCSVQLCFKSGSIQLNAEPGLEWLRQVLSSPWIWAGIACYLGAFVSWMTILKDTELSFAFPATALGYVSILLVSQAVFQESIDSSRWLGVALIIAGFLCMIGETEG